MFNIDEQIKNWRLHLSSTGVYQDSDIDELENHIHEEMPRLKKKGLTDEESFLVAIHRIGGKDNLSKEFQKVNRAFIWKRRIFWMLSGYFLIHFLMLLVKVGQSVYFLTTNRGYITTPIMGSQFPIPIIPIPLALLLALFLYFLITKIPVNDTGFSMKFLRKTPLTSFLLILGLIIAVIGHIPFSMILATSANPEIFGRMSAANSLFDIVWNCFLAISLGILAIRSNRIPKNRIESVTN